MKFGFKGIILYDQWRFYKCEKKGKRKVKGIPARQKENRNSAETLKSQSVNREIRLTYITVNIHSIHVPEVSDMAGECFHLLYKI